MTGIAQYTVTEFQNLVAGLNSKYISDWNKWISTPTLDRPEMLGKTLRKWQACRPNRMRRRLDELKKIVDDSSVQIAALGTFNIADQRSLENHIHIDAITMLWDVLEELSFTGRARNGKAGVVGISKAVMLLTDGRVGPAFDSKVRKAIKLRDIKNSAAWLNALKTVNHDIQQFEQVHNTTFSAAKPSNYAHLNNGRIYDMALGPR